jgi:hypothetical protein
MTLLHSFAATKDCTSIENICSLLTRGSVTDCREVDVQSAASIALRFALFDLKEAV